jgi:hypothetical protein
VEYLLGVFTAARLRLAMSGARFETCGSYRVVGGAREHGGWVDPSYEAAATPNTYQSLL